MENKELTYTSPTLGRTLASFGLDLFLFLLFGTFFLLLSQRIMIQGPNYSQARTEQISMQVDSRLYISDNGTISLPDYLNSQDLTSNQKSAVYENRLTYFFVDYLSETPSAEGEKTYAQDKANAKTNGQAMFDASGIRVLTNPDYDASYLSWYESEYSVALGKLRYLPQYQSLTKKILGLQIAWAVGSYTLAFSLFYLVIPLCFSRGKRTIGMLSTSLYSVGKDGLSISWWRQLLLFLFQYFIVTIGSFVAILIPFAVSLSMLVFRPARQSLSQYVCGVFLIDGRNEKIYKNKLEVIAETKND